MNDPTIVYVYFVNSSKKTYVVLGDCRFVFSVSTCSGVTKLHLRDEERREQTICTDYLRKISFSLALKICEGLFSVHLKTTQDDWVRL